MREGLKNFATQLSAETGPPQFALTERAMGVSSDLAGPVFAKDRRVASIRDHDGGTGHQSIGAIHPVREARSGPDRAFGSRRAVCRDGVPREAGQSRIRAKYEPR